MKTILFVDDEPWFQEGLRAVLESRGYECLSATDMTSGLESMAERDVAVVVTDIMMPPGARFPDIDSQETGFHFINKLLKDWPLCQIICLSVIADQQKIRRLRALKVDYLRKGEVPLATVVQTIERAAGGGGQKIWRF